MREPDQTQNRPRRPGHLSKQWQIILTIGLIALLLLGGLLYAQRHQVHQLIQSLTLPAPQPVHITPLTLPPHPTAPVTPLSPTAPAQVASTDWTMYHQNNTHSGFIVGMPAPTSLTNLW